MRHAQSAASSEDLVFNYRMLRLIIGALAFAFPSTVILLTGKITTSISASYYEEGNRDVFVGFLFILGALLIAYKGHRQGELKPESENLWAQIRSWVRVYQEDIVSCIGGFAAIFTALYPTACDGCPINAQARIHLTGAGILFASVVYFGLIAFLRSLNQKLVEENPGFAELVDPSRSTQAQGEAPSIEDLEYPWFRNVPIFFRIAIRIIKDYIKKDEEQLARAWLNKRNNSAEVAQLAKAWLKSSLHQDEIQLAEALLKRIERENKLQLAKALTDFKEKKPNLLNFMLTAYERKILRGVVYVMCGSLILVTLIWFLYLVMTQPEVVAHSTITFNVETISLIFFGIAWMTASKLEYIQKILDWWHSGETSAPPKTEALQAEAE